MTFINKILAIAMLPFSILIILEATKLFTLELPFDKALIGALLMIALQVMNILFAKTHNNHVSPVHGLIAVILMVPAIAYIISLFTEDFFGGNIPLILGVMMLVEGLYALH